MSFFGEVIDEMKKVEWSSGRELARDTGTVIETIAIFAVFFFIVDSIIKWLLGLVVSRPGQ